MILTVVPGVGVVVEYVAGDFRWRGMTSEICMREPMTTIYTQSTGSRIDPYLEHAFGAGPTCGRCGRIWRSDHDCDVTG